MDIYTTCLYCGFVFTKDNKPRIMSCSHNICSQCYLINSSMLMCLKCNKKFTRKQINKFPVNFALLEIDNCKEKVDYSKIDIFYCKECNINLYGDYHKKQYNHDIIKKEKLSIDSLKQRAQELMNEYKKYNDKYKGLNKKYSNNFFDILKENANSINFDTIDPFMLLSCCGVLNPSDQAKLSSYYKNIHTKESINNIIEKSKTFDELSSNYNNLPDSEKDGMSYNTFLSLLFASSDIQNKKLITIDSTLKNLEVKLNETKHCDTLLQELSYSINYHIYDSLLGFDYKIAYFIINHTIIIFEPIDKKYLTFAIPNEVNNITAYAMNQDRNLYLYDNVRVYQYDLNRNKLITLQSTNYSHKNGCLFLLGHNLYILSSQFFELLRINEDIKESKWEILTSYSAEFEKPKIVAYEENKIVIVDISKTFGDFFVYTVDKDIWKKISLDTPQVKAMTLSTATFFNLKLICCFGLYNKEENKYDEGVYEIRFDKKDMRQFDSIAINKENMKVLQISHAYTKKSTYILICYEKNNNMIQCDLYCRKTKGKFEFESSVEYPK